MGPVRRAQGHPEGVQPTINTEVANQNVHTSTFVGARADAHLEETDHSEVLLSIGCLFNSRYELEAFSFVNPLIRFNLGDEAERMGRAGQSQLNDVLKFGLMLNEAQLE